MSDLTGRTLEPGYVVTGRHHGSSVERWEATSTADARRRFLLQPAPATLRPDLARKVSRLGHPFIGNQLNDVIADGQPVVVYALAAGEDLGLLIARGGPPVRAVARQILLELSSALDAMHGAGVAHGGLRPASVLVDRLRDAQFVTLLEVGFAGAGADARADVAALAAVAEHLLAGQPAPGTAHAPIEPLPPAALTVLADGREGRGPERAGDLVEALLAALGLPGRPQPAQPLLGTPFPMPANPPEVPRLMGNPKGVRYDLTPPPVTPIPVAPRLTPPPGEPPPGEPAATEPPGEPPPAEPTATEPVLGFPPTPPGGTPILPEVPVLMGNPKGSRYDRSGPEVPHAPEAPRRAPLAALGSSLFLAAIVAFLVYRWLT